jgi:hypothetical protein
MLYNPIEERVDRGNSQNRKYAEFENSARACSALPTLCRTSYETILFWLQPGKSFSRRFIEKGKKPFSDNKQALLLK